ncbi:MAG TPA: nitrate ABC transporter permease, partial [Anaerolineae bacterium]
WRTRFWYDANRYRGFVGWVVIFIIFIVLLDRLALTPLQQYAFRWRDAQAQSSDTTESSMVSS